MLNKLRSFFVFQKKEVEHDVGLAFIEPVMSSIKKDVSFISTSFNDIQKMVDSGFKIGFDRIPSAQLSDLIEKTSEFSALIEASDVQNKVKLTEILAEMHDNAVRCSSMSAFLVNSDEPDLNLNEIFIFLGRIKSGMEEVCRLS